MGKFCILYKDIVAVSESSYDASELDRDEDNGNIFTTFLVNS